MRRDRRPAALALALSLAVAASSGAAAAQPSGNDKFKADQLFRDGKRLYGEGKYNEACEALASSDELDPAIGTLGLLAACHEKQGDLVAAWKEYLETKRRADAKGDSRAEVAAEQAQAIKKRLARLTIRSAGKEPSLEVKRDGEALPASMLGVEVPVNPGAHEVRASVPGAPEWKRSVALKEGEARALEIPPLSLIEAGGGSVSVPRWVAFVVGGVGLASVGAGAAAGLVAISKNEASLNKLTCPPIASQCAERDAAYTAATLSTVAFIVGGAAVTAGVVLLFMSDDSTPKPASVAKASGISLSVAPAVGASGGGAMIVGAF